MTYTPEQIERAFDALPEEVQDMLYSPELERSVQKVGVEAGLLIDQMKTLNSIANFAVMDLLPQGNIAEEVARALGVGSDEAQNIAARLIADIIMPTNDLKRKLIDDQKRRAEEARELGIELEEEEQGTEPPVAPQEEPRPETLVATETPREGMPPENLPTEDTAGSFLPNLAPKTAARAPIDEAMPPFEEKMKQVFTGATTSAGDLALDTPPPQAPAVTHRTDPYREPIE